MSDQQKKLTLFISYAHEDSTYRSDLDKHLSSLKNQGMIATWYDGEIVAGQEWEPTILSQLNSADIILLLISADFLASKYIVNVEMKQALVRHEASQARVIPILLRPVDYAGTRFAKIEALPTNAKKQLRPVALWPNRDAAYANIAKGIRKAVEQLTINRPPQNP